MSDSETKAKHAQKIAQLIAEIKAGPSVPKATVVSVDSKPAEQPVDREVKFDDADDTDDNPIVLDNVRLASFAPLSPDFPLNLRLKSAIWREGGDQRNSQGKLLNRSGIRFVESIRSFAENGLFDPANVDELNVQRLSLGLLPVDMQSSQETLFRFRNETQLLVLAREGWLKQFNQNERCRKALLATGEKPLVYLSSDLSLGAQQVSPGIFRGENQLGTLLMRIRSELRRHSEEKTRKAADNLNFYQKLRMLLIFQKMAKDLTTMNRFRYKTVEQIWMSDEFAPLRQFVNDHWDRNASSPTEFNELLGATAPWLVSRNAGNPLSVFEKELKKVPFYAQDEDADFVSSIIPHHFLAEFSLDMCIVDEFLLASILDPACRALFVEKLIETGRVDAFITQVIEHQNDLLTTEERAAAHDRFENAVARKNTRKEVQQTEVDQALKKDDLYTSFERDFVKPSEQLREVLTKPSDRLHLLGSLYIGPIQMVPTFDVKIIANPKLRVKRAEYNDPGLEELINLTGITMGHVAQWLNSIPGGAKLLKRLPLSMKPVNLTALSLADTNAPDFLESESVAERVEIPERRVRLDDFLKLYTQKQQGAKVSWENFWKQYKQWYRQKYSVDPPRVEKNLIKKDMIDSRWGEFSEAGETWSGYSLRKGMDADEVDQDEDEEDAEKEDAEEVVDVDVSDRSDDERDEALFGEELKREEREEREEPVESPFPVSDKLTYNQMKNWRVKENIEQFLQNAADYGDVFTIPELDDQQTEDKQNKSWQKTFFRLRRLYNGLMEVATAMPQGALLKMLVDKKSLNDILTEKNRVARQKAEQEYAHIVNERKWQVIKFLLKQRKTHMFENPTQIETMCYSDKDAREDLKELLTTKPFAMLTQPYIKLIDEDGSTLQMSVPPYVRLSRDGKIDDAKTTLAPNTKVDKYTFIRSDSPRRSHPRVDQYFSRDPVRKLIWDKFRGFEPDSPKADPEMVLINAVEYLYRNWMTQLKRDHTDMNIVIRRLADELISDLSQKLQLEWLNRQTDFSQSFQSKNVKQMNRETFAERMDTQIIDKINDPQRRQRSEVIAQNMLDYLSTHELRAEPPSLEQAQRVITRLNEDASVYMEKNFNNYVDEYLNGEFGLSQAMADYAASRNRDIPKVMEKKKTRTFATLDAMQRYIASQRVQPDGTIVPSKENVLVWSPFGVQAELDKMAPEERYEVEDIAFNNRATVENFLTSEFYQKYAALHPEQVRQNIARRLCIDRVFSPLRMVTAEEMQQWIKHEFNVARSNALHSYQQLPTNPQFYKPFSAQIQSMLDRMYPQVGQLQFKDALVRFRHWKPEMQREFGQLFAQFPPNLPSGEVYKTEADRREFILPETAESFELKPTERQSLLQQVREKRAEGSTYATIKRMLGSRKNSVFRSQPKEVIEMMWRDGATFDEIWTEIYEIHPDEDAFGTSQEVNAVRALVTNIPRGSLMYQTVMDQNDPFRLVLTSQYLAKLKRTHPKQEVQKISDAMTVDDMSPLSWNSTMCPFRTRILPYQSTTFNAVVSQDRGEKRFAITLPPTCDSFAFQSVNHYAYAMLAMEMLLEMEEYKLMVEWSNVQLMLKGVERLTSSVGSYLKHRSEWKQTVMDAKTLAMDVLSVRHQAELPEEVAKRLRDALVRTSTLRVAHTRPSQLFSGVHSTLQRELALPSLREWVGTFFNQQLENLSSPSHQCTVLKTLSNDPLLFSIGPVQVEEQYIQQVPTCRAVLAISEIYGHSGYKVLDTAQNDSKYHVISMQEERQQRMIDLKDILLASIPHTLVIEKKDKKREWQKSIPERMMTIRQELFQSLNHPNKDLRSIQRRVRSAKFTTTQWFLTIPRLSREQSMILPGKAVELVYMIGQYFLLLGTSRDTMADITSFVVKSLYTKCGQTRSPLPKIPDDFREWILHFARKVAIELDMECVQMIWSYIYSLGVNLSFSSSGVSPIWPDRWLSVVVSMMQVLRKVCEHRRALLPTKNMVSFAGQLLRVDQSVPNDASMVDNEQFVVALGDVLKAEFGATLIDSLSIAREMAIYVYAIAANDENQARVFYFMSKDAVAIREEESIEVQEDQDEEVDENDEQEDDNENAEDAGDIYE